jgi:hypothetical protein
MVREDCPSFQLPAEIRGNFEQSPVQYSQSRFTLELVLAQIGAGCNKASPANAEPMSRRMWPCNLVGRHET